MTKILFLLVILASSNRLQARKMKSMCKGPKDVDFEVMDFMLNVSWKPRRYFDDDNTSYIVQTCLSGDDCSTNNSSDWVNRSCKKHSSGTTFQCIPDVPYTSEYLYRVCAYLHQALRKRSGCPDELCTRFPRPIDEINISSRTSFSKPDISITDYGSNWITVNIKEPTDKILCEYEKLIYSLYVALVEESWSNSTCVTHLPSTDLKYITKQTETIKDISAEVQMNGIHSKTNKTLNDLLLRTVMFRNSNPTHQINPCPIDKNRYIWDIKELKPNTEYCIIGSYNTDRTYNSNGPSKRGYLRIKTKPEKQVTFISGSSKLVETLVPIGILFVFICSIIVGIRVCRFVRKAKKLDASAEECLLQTLQEIDAITVRNNNIKSLAEEEHPDRYVPTNTNRWDESTEDSQESTDSRRTTLTSMSQSEDSHSEALESQTSEEEQITSGCSSTTAQSENSNLNDYIMHSNLQSSSANTSSQCSSSMSSSKTETECDHSDSTSQRPSMSRSLSEPNQHNDERCSSFPPNEDATTDCTQNSNKRHSTVPDYIKNSQSSSEDNPASPKTTAPDIAFGFTGYWDDNHINEMQQQ